MRFALLSYFVFLLPMAFFETATAQFQSGVNCPIFGNGSSKCPYSYTCPWGSIPSPYGCVPEGDTSTASNWGWGTGGAPPPPPPQTIAMGPGDCVINTVVYIGCAGYENDPRRVMCPRLPANSNVSRRTCTLGENGMELQDVVGAVFNLEVSNSPLQLIRSSKSIHELLTRLTSTGREIEGSGVEMAIGAVNKIETYGPQFNGAMDRILLFLKDRALTKDELKHFLDGAANLGDYRQFRDFLRNWFPNGGF